MRSERPNFILIVTDQHRGDCLGCAGHPVLLTPQMDMMAARGMRFERAYSTCPTCIPARRSLMTGQFAATHGVVGFETGVPLKAPTLPQVLRDGGYQTALVGRHMHLHPPRCCYGYERVEMTHCDDEMGTRYWDELGTAAEPGRVREYGHGISGNGWSARPWHLDESLHEVHWTVSESLRWLREYRDPTRPFFLTVGFCGPHPPLTPPAFYMERYLRQALPAPAIGDWAPRPTGKMADLGVQSPQVELKGEALRSCMAAYLGYINYIDDQLYRLLGTHNVDQAILRNTMVIFTADHGEMLGDHYMFRKACAYEGSARIPMLIYGPRELGLERAAVCDRPVCLEDVMPTVLELAGCGAPEGMDGRSLVPLLRGRKDARWREYLHGEHAEHYEEFQPNHYLTDGREKYIWLPRSGREMLFDLREDPRELHDLSREAGWAERLKLWQGRLVERLKNRPEGFTDGARLIPGRAYPSVMAHARGR